MDPSNYYRIRELMKERDMYKWVLDLCKEKKRNAIIVLVSDDYQENLFKKTEGSAHFYRSRLISDSDSRREVFEERHSNFNSLEDKNFFMKMMEEYATSKLKKIEEELKKL